MDFRQLVYFQRVAEAGSFSRAAERIRIAQPALSQQIASLEAELGIPLFVRHARGVALTQAGVLFLEHATLVLRHLQLAKSAVAEAGRQPRGEVGLGLAPSLAVALLVPLLAAVWDELPLVNVRLAEAHSGYLGDLIRQGRLDFAALFDLPDPHGLELETLFTEELYLVSPLGQEVGSSEAVPLATLAGLPLLLPTRSHGLRLALDRASFEAGLSLTVRAEIDAVGNIIAAIRAGLGHSVLSRVSVSCDPLRPQLLARRIVAPMVRRSAQLAIPANRPLSSAAQAVIAIARRLVQDHVAGDTWHVLGKNLPPVSGSAPDAAVVPVRGPVPYDG